MESAEASGKTVEDALNRALAQLGASRDQVEFVVLDEGRKGGLFGRGAREAQVRVERIAGAPTGNAAEAPETRAPRGSQPQRGSGGQRGRGDSNRNDGNRADGPGDARGGGQRQRSGPAGGRGRPDSGRQTRTGFDVAVPKLTDSDFLKPRAYGEDDAAPAPETAPAARAPRGQRPPRAEGQDRAEGRDRGDRSDRGDRGDRRPREEERNIEADINAEEVDFAARVLSSA